MGGLLSGTTGYVTHFVSESSTFESSLRQVFLCSISVIRILNFPCSPLTTYIPFQGGPLSSRGVPFVLPTLSFVRIHCTALQYSWSLITAATCHPNYFNN